jgi:hypothetical protein
MKSWRSYIMVFCSVKLRELVNDVWEQALDVVTMQEPEYEGFGMRVAKRTGASTHQTLFRPTPS